MEKATTFNKDIIAKINRVLKFVLENTYSDFYRKKYEGLEIKEIGSYDDFLKIPLLKKDEFLAIPVEKRTFVAADEIKYFSSSSGTTNNKIPAIVPHCSFGYENMDFNESKISSMGVRRVLAIHSPLSPAFIKHLTMPRKNIVIVPGDANNLPMTAKLARELQIEAIITTPTKLYFFIKHLADTGFKTKNIKWIHLGAEFCSAQKLQYFKSIFPESLIDFGFSTSETGGSRGYRCEHLARDERPYVFHPARNKMAEVAGTEGNILGFGESGELIHTDLEVKAFPLIRYKTNDIGSISDLRCACGEKFLLTLGGRMNFDVLKFSGVTLYAELIANATDTAKEYVDPQFQMHVFEEPSAGKIKPKLQLHLKLKNNFRNRSDLDRLKKELEDMISSGLQLGAYRTLKQLADQDIFYPLEIIFVDAWPENSEKTKNIISHLN
ncbi:MAG: hypothetical protein WC788_07810 [Candidatus Paceibacterota bacterium]|jgi:phenylacetate-CoA ligase